MSLFDLKSLVSTEDFADAHEPLNDGVKEVPNAQTVAAGVKTGDVGKDTTSQGPAKVIPEKEDTDDETKTEHNVVKESAEKSGTNHAVPTPTAKPTEPSKVAGDIDDKPAKPFEPKEPDEEADDKEPLEHTTEKAAKDDLEKTEKATKGLEAYAPKARRFDIIGHPKVQAGEVVKMIGYINRRAGIKGDVTVSAESIDAAIAVGRNRIAQLEREARLLGTKVSNEDITDSMGIPNEQIDVIQEAVVTAEPTEHGAPPMAPEAAAALTEQEIDPFDVPLLELQRVEETIGVLEQSQVAIEQYRQIVRNNPRMSRQAAAVLHAGLQHIDQVCGLKVRATGLENYDTSPRAAMEDANVNERSLLKRSAEIGAKLLGQFKELARRAADVMERYSMGIDKLEGRVKETSDILKKLPSEPSNESAVIKPAPADLFLDGEFVGDHITPIEFAVVRKINQHIYNMVEEYGRPVIGALKSKGISEDTVRRIEELNAEHESNELDQELVIPAGTLVLKGAHFEITPPSGGGQAEYTLNLNEIEDPRQSIRGVSKFLEDINAKKVIDKIDYLNTNVTKAIMAAREGGDGNIDEALFQKIQGLILNGIMKSLSATHYFAILYKLLNSANRRITVLNQIAKAWG